MATPTLKPSKKRLIVAFIFFDLLVASFFIYKYTYIALERRKYGQVEVAITKVADDLRTQNITTTLFRGCSHDQGKFISGPLFCTVGITYQGDENNDKAETTAIKLVSAMEKNMFTKDSRFNLSYDVSPRPSGFTIYRYDNSTLQCKLYLDNTWDENTKYEVSLSCGDTSKYLLF